MSLILAGIDEAGYGPTLGPLCVAMSAFRVSDWSPGDASPDLWARLSSAVCASPRDPRHRVPIADSKKLKLSNDSTTRHPLIHLEHGVLAFLRSLAAPTVPAHDADLLAALSCDIPSHEWYAGAPTPLPVGIDSGRLAISSSRLASALESAGIEFLGLWVHAIDERAFNEIVERTGTKAEVTATAWGAHLRRIVEIWAQAGIGSDEEPPRALALRLVGDQLGGRTRYESFLARELPGHTVVCLSEGESRSRYALRPPEPTGRDGSPPTAPAEEHPDQHRAIVQFMPEAESAHLPVALASMGAKLVRELLMARFNRYWCARVRELKPTAGYALDARRWLHDMRDVLHPLERRDLVRRA